MTGSEGVRILRVTAVRPSVRSLFESVSARALIFSRLTGTEEYLTLLFFIKKKTEYIYTNHHHENMPI